MSYRYNEGFFTVVADAKPRTSIVFLRPPIPIFRALSKINRLGSNTHHLNQDSLPARYGKVDCLRKLHSKYQGPLCRVKALVQHWR